MMNTLFFAILLTAAAPPFEAQSLDGPRVVGPLTALNAEQVSLQGADGVVSRKLTDLVKLSNKKPQSAPAKLPDLCVELQGGSVVNAQGYECRDGRVRITLGNGQVLELPARDVLTVRLQAETESLAAQWRRITNMQRDADVIVLRKEDALDYHKGVLHDITADTVQFDVDGEILPVKRARVFGLAYYQRAAVDGPAATCCIRDIWGSRWLAHGLSLGDKLQWTIAADAHVTLPVEQVVEIDFSQGKIAYLSDMDPTNVQWTPFFGGGKPLAAVEKLYAPRRDADFAVGRLQLGGVEYTKGLAIHSRTEMNYELPSDFRRFHAVAGIADALRPHGKVQLTIRGDNKVLYQGVLSGTDAPAPLDLDIAGMRRLQILVDFADMATVGNHLLLCNARITK